MTESYGEDNEPNEQFDAERFEEENRRALSGDAEQASLRKEYFTPRRLDQLGSTPGYAVPWSISVDSEGRYWVRADEEVLIRQVGTATIRIERQEDGMHAIGEVGPRDIKSIDEAPNGSIELHGDFTAKPEASKGKLAGIRKRLAGIFKSQ